jgi:hypothetical protein
MLTTWRTERPPQNEYAPYYEPYMIQIPDGDILETLTRQREGTLKLIAGIPEVKAAFRYAPEKWSIKQVLGHLTDGERVFAYRALCVARGEETPLPRFDENRYAELGGHDQRLLTDIAREFDHLRISTLELFESFDRVAWTRTGTASNQPISVRALIWIIAGHESHHMKVVQERYLK